MEAFSRLKMKSISGLMMLFVVCFTCLFRPSQAQSLDIKLLRTFNIDRNTNLDPSFKLITETASPLSMACPLSIYAVGLIKRDSTIRRKGMYIAGTMAISAAITVSAKFGFNRPRPFITHSDIIQLTDVGSNSFPSGHTSNAFATATAFTFAYPKWYVALPSFAWASAVGYSRMHLGVHYPSDVAVGALVGAGSAWLSCWLSKKIFETYDKKMSLRKARR
jgi:membrane-associated phospholipid phosphatase